jgi:hypothetical protein
MKKYLRWFYIATVAVMLIGAVINIAEFTFDLYQLWASIAYVVGLYLIEEGK